MIHISPHIKSWMANCKDIRKLLSHAQRALRGDNPEVTKSLLSQARKAKEFNDIIFGKICQVIQKTLEEAKPKSSTLACPHCGQHDLIGEVCFVEGDVVSQHMSCPACQTHWLNRYTYHGYMFVSGWGR